MAEVEHSSPGRATPDIEKAQVQEVDQAVPAAATAPVRVPLQPPEIIRRMTPEQREALEKHLKRKIDWRLMPAIIVMYILNYIDR